MIARIRRLLRNLYLDLRYGRFLGGSKRTPYAHLGAKDTMNSDYRALALLLDPEMRAGDVFVDVGCGRGRVINFVLHQGRAARVYGLELDPEVAAEVAQRLRHRKDVTIAVGNCLETLPADATVIYAFNPFTRALMEQFKERLFALYGPSGRLRGLRFIYYNAVDADLFAGDPRCRVTRLTLPAGFHPAVKVEFSEC